MIEKILQYEITGLYQDILLLSTVRIDDMYETALLFSDGEELEMYRFKEPLEAIDCNQAIMYDCWKKVQNTYPFMKDVPLDRVARRIV